MKHEISITICFLILSVFAILSCSQQTELISENQSIGGGGLIVLKRAEIPFQISSTTNIDADSDNNFSFEFTESNILIDPVKPLRVGEKINFKVSDQADTYDFKSIVRKPCLAFLGDVDVSPEIWKFCGQDTFPLTQTEGNVIDYSVAKNGDWIIYTAKNESGGSDIWKMDRAGENLTLIHSCGDKVCEQAAINSQGTTIAFWSNDSSRSLYLINLNDNKKILIENGKISNLDFSPNDKFLRYYVEDTRYLRVLNIQNLELIKTIVSDSDLIGTWRKDSSGFLFGQYDYWGGIAYVDLYELNVPNEVESLVFNGADSSLDIFKPITLIEDNLIVLARSGFNGNRKQIREINRNGETVVDVTSDFQYDHSSISWNSVEKQLAYQRFELSSSNVTPEIWIWDKQANTFQMIAINAAHAEWVY